MCDCASYNEVKNDYLPLDGVEVYTCHDCGKRVGLQQDVLTWDNYENDYQI